MTYWNHTVSCNLYSPFILFDSEFLLTAYTTENKTSAGLLGVCTFIRGLVVKWLRSTGDLGPFSIGVWLYRSVREKTCHGLGTQPYCWLCRQRGSFLVGQLGRCLSNPICPLCTCTCVGVGVCLFFFKPKEPVLEQIMAPLRYTYTQGPWKAQNTVKQVLLTCTQQQPNTHVA